MDLSALMRHLLDVWRLRQLLGDDADQCAENSFSLLDGEGPPKLLGSGMAVQGQRSLKRCSGKDFEHERVVPTATTAFHDEAFAAGMLLQQRESEAIEPCKVFTHVFIPNTRLILAIGNGETPVTGIFNAPVTADSVGESLHTHPKTADVMANLERLIPVANALRYHHADRLHAFPQFEPGQALRHRHLNVASRLFTPMSGLLGHIVLVQREWDKRLCLLS